MKTVFARDDIRQNPAAGRGSRNANLLAGPAAALVLAVLIAGCKPHTAAPPPPVVVRYRPAESAGDAHRHSRTEYVGILRGDRETDLGFRVNGTLALIGPEHGSEDWHEGASVKRGDLLAQLTQTDFLSAVADAKASEKLYDSMYERARTLREQGAVSPQDLDLALSRRDSSKAALSKREQELADSKILAPFDGMIVGRLANAGETIMPGRTVLRIADMRTNTVEVGIPDTVIGRIKEGDAVSVMVSAFEGRPRKGWITEIGVAAKEGSRLFPVKVKIPNDDPQHPLRVGMSATADFGSVQPVPEGAVVVPLSALIQSSLGAGTSHLAVFVIQKEGGGSVARERRVETDDLLGSSIIITRNLKAGEWVATFGAANLHDGDVVEARPENGAGKE